MTTMCVLCELVIYSCSNSEETTQLRRKATWEKGPTTEPEPVTYALTRSFSQASYRIGHAPLYHTAAYVTDVPNP